MVRDSLDYAVKILMYGQNKSAVILAYTAYSRARSYEGHLKEIENLTLKASIIRSEGKEQTEINRLQAMLKGFGNTLKHILESMKKVIAELESAQ